METVDIKTQAPAEAVVAPKPAVAKPAPKPAAPAVPAENEVKPIAVEPAELRAEMERLKAENFFGTTNRKEKDPFATEMETKNEQLLNQQEEA